MSRFLITVAGTVFNLSLIAQAAGHAAPGGAAPTPTPTPVSSATPSASASPAALGAPKAEKVTPGDAQALRTQFTRAQELQSRALAHRHQAELRELKASQAARQKDWENREKLARHAFFKENAKGPERRAYIRDFLDRRAAFRKFLADERASRMQEQDARRQAVQAEQKLHLREFNESLARGERPPASVWPSPGQ